jgi:hypothetical protein
LRHFGFSSVSPLGQRERRIIRDYPPSPAEGLTRNERSVALTLFRNTSAQPAPPSSQRVVLRSLRQSAPSPFLSASKNGGLEASTAGECYFPKWAVIYLKLLSLGIPKVAISRWWSVRGWFKNTLKLWQVEHRARPLPWLERAETAQPKLDPTWARSRYSIESSPAIARTDLLLWLATPHPSGRQHRAAD